MIEAGLLIHGDDIAVPYDRFQNRVMFPIHDRARQGRRLRRTGDGAGRQGQIPQFAGDRAFPQGRAAVQPPPRPQSRARQGRGDRGRGLCRRHRYDAGRIPADRRAARHGAHRRAMRAAVVDVRDADPVLRRRQGRPQGGLSRDRDRAAADRARQEPCGSRCCPRARTPTISPNPAAARRSPRCSRRRGRSPKCCSCARPRNSFSIRRRSARRWNGDCASSPAASATRRCAGTMRRTWRSVCARCSAARRRHDARRQRGLRPTPAGRFPGRFDFGPRRAWRTRRCRRSGSRERSRDPPREICILAALLNHPRLIDAAGRGNRRAGIFERKPRRLPLASARRRAGRPIPTPRASPPASARRAWPRSASACCAAARRMPNWWCLAEDAQPSDVETVLRQSMALQRKSGALHRELKSAASALESDPSERNLAHLLDIKASLADLGDAEAAVEGFGAASGREGPPL